jgi:aminoglycoside 3-N-acetyltransferase
VTIGMERLIQAVDELTPRDRPVMVHASLRSFGEWIEGGAETLLDALLSGRRTVLVPSFSESHFDAVPTAIMRPARNGVDYADFAGQTREGPQYTVGCGLIDSSMGTVPAKLIARSGARRGQHPLDSFAALGPQAGELVGGQSAVDVYSPLRALAELGGTVLLMGVGLNRMTALHLAEQESGRRLFVRWTRGKQGEVRMVETGSCSEGFPRLEAHLRPCASTVVVGRSRWTAFPAKETITAASAVMSADPGITHCSDDECIRCRDSIAGGPIGSVVLG